MVTAHIENELALFGDVIGDEHPEIVVAREVKGDNSAVLGYAALGNTELYVHVNAEAVVEDLGAGAVINDTRNGRTLLPAADFPLAAVCVLVNIDRTELEVVKRTVYRLVLVSAAAVGQNKAGGIVGNQISEYLIFAVILISDPLHLVLIIPAGIRADEVDHQVSPANLLVVDARIEVLAGGYGRFSSGLIERIEAVAGRLVIHEVTFRVLDSVLLAVAVVYLGRSISAPVKVNVIRRVLVIVAR